MKRFRLAVWRVKLIAIAVTATLTTGFAQQSDDLSALSLESLMNIRVSLASRHQEELRKTAAAAFVLTREDIRSSGATDVAELLRLVPGVNVARINSSTWAVSVRGFNERYANKLLVLVDGRSVYDPAFSGVYWNLQNLVLDDIERIEVVRGPGATMWGANAVNGVISITTRLAADTEGGLIVAGTGTDRAADGSFRFGDSIGRNLSYRFSMNQTTRDAVTTDSADAWNLTRAALRVDWQQAWNNVFTFEGSAFRGVAGSDSRNLTSLTPVSYQNGLLFREAGGHLRSQWNHSLKDDSQLTVRFYFDQHKHNSFIGRNTRTLDFDLQHTIKGERHDIVWGAGHREVHDAFRNSLGVGFDPASKTTRLSSAFFQDTFAVIPDKFYVTAGSKLERNSYTGFEIQPAARMLWMPGARHAAWTSVARAVRSANRVDRDFRVNAALVPMGRVSGLVTILGQESTRSETVNSYEAGYRFQAHRRVWLDVATFYNVYDHLFTAEPGAAYSEATPAPAHIALPTYFDNQMKGKTYGGEVAGRYRVTDTWSITGSYSRLRIALQPYLTSRDAEAREAEGESPENQFHIGSSVKLPNSFELAGHAYFNGRLESFPVSRYTRLDLNVSWKRFEDVDLQLVGQNLLGKHREFGETAGSNAHTVGRSVQARISWRF